MRIFSKGGEIRLTREDIMQIIEYGLNDCLYLDQRQSVKSITLHPDAKYVIRVEVENAQVKNEKPLEQE